ncbi:MAG: serine/threonine-protein kinase [Pirellulales bacterium]
MKPSLCPDRPRLAAALAGKLPVDDIDEVTDHLDDCPACAALAEEIERASHRQAEDSECEAAKTPADHHQLERLLAWAKALPTDAGIVDPGVALPAVGPERYELLDEIDSGGMGRIVRGRDPILGRYLAVKMLGNDLTDSAAARRRFLAEARISSRLRHPGILPVYELGQFTDGRPYFTMPLIEGRSMSALLKARPDPTHDLARFVTIFQQICQTLAFAHSHGIIHRDLKPSNVMVGPFGEVQVIDWGLSKSLFSTEEVPAGGPQPSEWVLLRGGRAGDGLSVAGALIGTPAYMAPEQARGEVERVGKCSDVFSLGAILCEILTDQPPYVGERAGVLAAARSADLGAAHARLDAASNRELAAMAKAWLAPGPDDRPREAAVVVQQLDEHLARLLIERLILPRSKSAGERVFQQPVSPAFQVVNDGPVEHHRHARGTTRHVRKSIPQLHERSARTGSSKIIPQNSCSAAANRHCTNSRRSSHRPDCATRPALGATRTRHRAAQE